MAISLKRTGSYRADAVKVLVYGQAGAGKTTLMATMPDPVILSAEAGILSIVGADVPYIEIKTLQDIGEAYQWLTESEEAKRFQSVGIDSISEIAEVVLSAEKQGKNKDPRAAYGEMQDKVASLIRSFRDLPGKHVCMAAKLERTKTETGAMLYGPSAPGNTTKTALPYFFDEVFALRIENGHRALLTSSDGVWDAKDRSGRLDMWEPPILENVFHKIRGDQ